MEYIMLNDFKINSYRGLEELEINKLKKVNVFVGPNNCGKTSILEAIILSGLFDNAELLVDALVARYHDFTPGLFEALFPNGKEPVICLKSKSNNDERVLHSHVTYDKKKIFRKSEDESRTNGRFLDAFELRFDYNYEDKPDLHDHFIMRFVDKGEQYDIDFGSSTKNTLNVHVPCKFISFSRFDRSDQFLTSLDELLNQNLRQELVEVLQIFDEDIENFEIVGVKRVVKLFKKSEEKPLTLYDYGNGMYKAFYIATSAILARGGILLVDEVEAGIHNKALEEFIQKLLLVCEKNNVQLFLTTHSLEAIDVLLNDCKDELENIVFYHIRNSKEKTVAKRYSGEKLLKLRNEIGFDIR